MAGLVDFAFALFPSGLMETDVGSLGFADLSEGGGDCGGLPAAEYQISLGARLDQSARSDSPRRRSR